jgi:RNA polymerase sigma-54 factor
VRPELILTQRPELRLQLSPQLIQRIEILQLGAQDLEDLVENELASNDALVAEKPVPKELEEKPPEQVAKQDEQAAEANPETSEPRVELDYWNDTYRERVRARGGDDDEDPKQQALNNTPTRTATLAEHLEDQLPLVDAPARIKTLARFVIENLDRNGWLKLPLAELVVPFHERFSLEDAEAALRVVQSLDPPGVGARDPKECLLLQLKDDHPLAPYLRRLIEHSLEDVGRNRLPKVAKDLGITVDEVKNLVDAMKKNFDPFPGRKWSSETNIRVRPDVRVQKVDDRFEIELVDHWMPRLSINPDRLRMLKDRALTGDLKKHVRRGIENARFLIESIEQRRRTLERVAQEIVKRQQDYLEHGVEHLKPLKMQEIADELGIHVSTVSRALKGKYIQTPQGIHEMKFFFTGASQGTDGVVESRTGVRERVRELVEKEEKHHPLSDEEIVDRLKTMGLNIARRTVTKYRKALKIPSSRQRREY